MKGQAPDYKNFACLKSVLGSTISQFRSGPIPPFELPMPRPDAIYRFGPYELRVRARELHKNGTRLKLRPQTFQVLLAMVESSREVVTREELRHLLWTDETFVDFEHGLNTAVKELRGLLNDSASQPRYIETLPKLGYRLIVPVTCDTSSPLQEPASQQPAPETPPVASASKPDKGQPRRLLWLVPLTAAALVAVISVAAYLYWTRAHPRGQAATARALLAVLPFENLTGDPNQDYFSDGLTEEMIGQLGGLDPQRLGVIARTSVMHYKHTQEPVPQIGRELGVQYVLEGSVRRESDKVRVSAQLIQVRDQTHLWSRQYDRDLSNLFVLQGEIAQEIADEVEFTFGAGGAKVAAASKPVGSPGSYEAYDLYLKGRFFWNKRTPEGFQEAANYFQQAIAKDPRYARAYAGLADTFGLMSTWNLGPPRELMPKARAAAVRALELDESLAEAHTSLALVAENYDYDWPTAEKEFRRAIQLDPSYATAHQWYAEYLSWQGRFDEALAESDKARQLDPMSLIIATDHGAILYYARQYDRAVAQLGSVLDMDPHFARATMIVGAYVEQRKFAEAMSAIDRFLPPDSSPWTCGEKAFVYARWGRTAEAQQYFAKLKRLVPPNEGAFSGYFLSAYLGLNMKDPAIVILHRAYAVRSNLMATLKVEPSFDPLRSDPRFQDLLRRVHLSE